MLKIYNTLCNSKVDFLPIDKSHIKLYVCGPTVYSFPHIGNARSVIVYDLLFRLLKYLYKKVTYVRNITDVDDKIIAAANAENKSIEEITSYYTAIFEQNMADLHCLRPNFQPKATDHINDIIKLIQRILDNQHAYVRNSYVYFNISTYSSYGRLSGKKQEDLISGSRIAIDKNKLHPADFILWKPTKDYGWDSPWGYGRPGWHIECSAMSQIHLGSDFDIHGGGADLQFPHHENEIAQNVCAYPNSQFAHYWVHNGFVLVEGEKMSKSIGNVLTVNDLLSKNVPSHSIRYALLSAHYKKPLNWTDRLLEESITVMNKFTAITQSYEHQGDDNIDEEIISALCDDLNTPYVFAKLHEQVHKINKGDTSLVPRFINNLQFLGLLNNNAQSNNTTLNPDYSIMQLIKERQIAKQQKDFTQADNIRSKLYDQGIELLDLKDGTTTWKKLIQ